MSARQLATCAVMTALLIAVQFVLGYVPGVELVTVFFLSFCVSYGIRCGLITATAFSLVRCIIWGFYPAVVLLYLIYYNLFALLFGALKKRNVPVWLCPVLFLLLGIASAYFAVSGVPVSILYEKRLTVMLWILFGICMALMLLYFVLLAVKRGTWGREIASYTALAAFCTVLFTLLDDVISPLVAGWSYEATLAYFYTSFLTMLPQTICAAASVFFLYLPLKRVFSATYRS